MRDEYSEEERSRDDGGMGRRVCVHDVFMDG